ncbi:PREDICTED: uncharacterized protein LOC108561254 isoform X2 [Nicrophorus vespilloides]|uniref:Uncharacterized protein LOC108561254 isoform X2 n=1 Tax=Nicrophorus vespilloides TaxID=110193 RepID=A0ABM1MJ54_NICVS|nr:PREDICTED: uncharacterized protein LOC108561254 isoform X2 [Nicrophorus vespilloides]
MFGKRKPRVSRVNNDKKKELLDSVSQTRDKVILTLKGEVRKKRKKPNKIKMPMVLRNLPRKNYSKKLIIKRFPIPEPARRRRLTRKFPYVYAVGMKLHKLGNRKDDKDAVRRVVKRLKDENSRLRDQAQCNLVFKQIASYHRNANKFWSMFLLDLISIRHPKLLSSITFLNVKSATQKYFMNSFLYYALNLARVYYETGSFDFVKQGIDIGRDFYGVQNLLSIFSSVAFEPVRFNKEVPASKPPLLNMDVFPTVVQMHREIGPVYKNFGIRKINNDSVIVSIDMEKIQNGSNIFRIQTPGEISEYNLKFDKDKENNTQVLVSSDDTVCDTTQNESDNFLKRNMWIRKEDVAETNENQILMSPGATVCVTAQIESTTDNCLERNPCITKENIVKTNDNQFLMSTDTTICDSAKNKCTTDDVVTNDNDMLVSPDDTVCNTAPIKSITDHYLEKKLLIMNESNIETDDNQASVSTDGEVCTNVLDIQKLSDQNKQKIFEKISERCTVLNMIKENIKVPISKESSTKKIINIVQNDITIKMESLSKLCFNSFKKQGFVDIHVNKNNSIQREVDCQMNKICWASAEIHFQAKHYLRTVPFYEVRKIMKAKIVTIPRQSDERSRIVLNRSSKNVHNILREVDSNLMRDENNKDSCKPLDYSIEASRKRIANDKGNGHPTISEQPEIKKAVNTHSNVSKIVRDPNFSTTQTMNITRNKPIKRSTNREAYVNDAHTGARAIKSMRLEVTPINLTTDSNWSISPDRRQLFIEHMYSMHKYNFSYPLYCQQWYDTEFKIYFKSLDHPSSAQHVCGDHNTGTLYFYNYNLPKFKNREIKMKIYESFQSVHQQTVCNIYFAKQHFVIRRQQMCNRNFDHHAYYRHTVISMVPLDPFQIQNFPSTEQDYSHYVQYPFVLPYNMPEDQLRYHVNTIMAILLNVLTTQPRALPELFPHNRSQQTHALGQRVELPVAHQPVSHQFFLPQPMPRQVQQLSLGLSHPRMQFNPVHAELPVQHHYNLFPQRHIFDQPPQITGHVQNIRPPQPIHNNLYKHPTAQQQQYHQLSQLSISQNLTAFPTNALPSLDKHKQQQTYHMSEHGRVFKEKEMITQIPTTQLSLSQQKIFSSFPVPKLSPPPVHRLESTLEQTPNTMHSIMEYTSHDIMNTQQPISSSQLEVSNKKKSVPCSPQEILSGQKPHSSLPQAVLNTKQPHSSLSINVLNRQKPVSSLQQELLNGQQLHSSLPKEVLNRQQPYSSLPMEVLNRQKTISSVPPEILIGHQPHSSLPMEVPNRQKAVSSLSQIIINGPQPDSSLAHKMMNRQQPHSSLPMEVFNRQKTISSLLPEILIGHQPHSSLQQEVVNRQQPYSSLSINVLNRQKPVSSLQQELLNGQQLHSSLPQEVLNRQQPHSSLPMEVFNRQKTISSLPPEILIGHQPHSSLPHEELSRQQAHSSLPMEVPNRQKAVSFLSQEIINGPQPDFSLPHKMLNRQQPHSSLPMEHGHQTHSSSSINVLNRQKPVSSLQQKLLNGQQLHSSLPQELPMDVLNRQKAVSSLSQEIINGPQPDSSLPHKVLHRQQPHSSLTMEIPNGQKPVSSLTQEMLNGPHYSLPLEELPQEKCSDILPKPQVSNVSNIISNLQEDQPAIALSSEQSSGTKLKPSISKSSCEIKVRQQVPDLDKENPPHDVPKLQPTAIMDFENLPTEITNDQQMSEKVQNIDDNSVLTVRESNRKRANLIDISDTEKKRPRKVFLPNKIVNSLSPEMEKNMISRLPTSESTVTFHINNDTDDGINLSLKLDPEKMKKIMQLLVGETSNTTSRTDKQECETQTCGITDISSEDEYAELSSDEVSIGDVVQNNGNWCTLSNNDNLMDMLNTMVEDTISNKLNLKLMKSFMVIFLTCHDTVRYRALLRLRMDLYNYYIYLQSKLHNIQLILNGYVVPSTYNMIYKDIESIIDINQHKVTFQIQKYSGYMYINYVDNLFRNILFDPGSSVSMRFRADFYNMEYFLSHMVTNSCGFNDSLAIFFKIIYEYSKHLVPQELQKEQDLLSNKDEVIDTIKICEYSSLPHILSDFYEFLAEYNTKKEIRLASFSMYSRMLRDAVMDKYYFAFYQLTKKLACK